MWVTLAKTPSNVDIEPKMAKYCNQAKISVEGLGPQLSHCNLWPKIYHAYKICWGKGDIEIIGMANQWLIEFDTRTV